jgi:DNA ligase-associated metallophosphoesterase
VLSAAFKNASMEIAVNGARLRLLPQRAAYIAEFGSLLVADAHLGKAHAFRTLGVPVPGGTTAVMLRHLSDALRSTAARRLIFVGDLLHSARGRSAAVLKSVADWRALHHEVAMTLVRGNHDSHAGDPPSAWNIDCVDGPLQLGPLTIAHHPHPMAGRYVIAGHVHPAAVLHGRAHGSLRLPCFHFGPQVGVLPAFGAFTGMHVLPRGDGDRVFVVAGDVVRALPCRAADPARR